MKKISIILLGLLYMFNGFASNPANSIEGVWLTSNQDAKIRIYQEKDGTFSGKIIWLTKPNYDNGRAKVDFKNAIDSLKIKPLIGLKIIQNFSYHSNDKIWHNGTIYDPDSGHTYKGHLWLEDCNSFLQVKGYIGYSFFGRRVKWTRMKEK